MRVIQYKSFGNPQDVVELAEMPSPLPGPREVVVSLEASPVHLADLKNINGEKWFRTESFPAIPGYEGVGRIKQIGSEVTGWAVNDRVFLPIAVGAWREERVIGAAGLWRAPEGVAAEQLSLVPINLQTAYVMLEVITPISQGDWIIQNAANSNVGNYLIRLAKLRGYRTINVVRRPELIPQLTALGADVVLLDGPDLAARVRTATGNGNVVLGIDAVAGAATQRLAECLSPNGVVANYGLLSGDSCQVAPEELMFRGISLTGFYTVRGMAKMTPDDLARMRREIVRHVEADLLQAPIAGVYAFNDVHTALAHAGRVGGDRNGKVILVP